MSGSFTPFVLPDWAETWQRGQDRSQQREANALAALAARREYEGQQRFENVLARPGVAEGLLGADPVARQRAIAALGTEGGTRGFQMVLPLITKERDDAAFDRIMNAPGGPGGGMAQPAPQMPQGAGGHPAPIAGGTPLPASPTNGVPTDPRARNAYFAQVRDAILNNADLTPEQREAALARVSAVASPARELPGGYRAPPGEGGVYVGLPGPTGVVPNAAPQAMPGPAPTQARPTGAPTLDWINRAMASGNSRVAEYARSWLPILTRDPSYSVANIGGQSFLMDSRTGQRIPLGPTQDVREETRNGIPGQTVNGVWQATTRPPDGYRYTAQGALEKVPGGPTEGADRREDFASTRQLREEFNGTQAARDLALVAPKIRAIRAALPVDSRASDIDIVFAFANLLDPGSVVREGEQVTLMRTAGLPDTVVGYLNGLIGGGRITPDARAAIAAQAESRFRIFSDAHDERLDYYRGLARDNGFNPEQIGRPVSRGETPQPGSPPARSAAPAAPPPSVSAAATALSRARAELGANASEQAILDRAQRIMGR